MSSNLIEDMHTEYYIFTQVAMFLPRRQFWRILAKYPDKTQKWNFTHWNHLLTLIFGQLIGVTSLRELTYIILAHPKVYII